MTRIVLAASAILCVASTCSEPRRAIGPSPTAPATATGRADGTGSGRVHIDVHASRRRDARGRAAARGVQATIRGAGGVAIADKVFPLAPR